MSQELFGMQPPGRRRRRQQQEDTSSYSVSEDQQQPAVDALREQREKRIQQLRLQSMQYGQHYQFNNRLGIDNFSNTSSSGSYINDRRQQQQQQHNHHNRNQPAQQRSRLYRVFNVGGIQQQGDNFENGNILPPVRNQRQSTTQENMLSERSNLNRHSAADNIMLGRRRNAEVNQDDLMLDASRGPMIVNQEQEDEEAKNEPSDEQLIFYNKFIEKIASQAALDLLMMILEVSFLMIAILILLYIRSKNEKLQIGLDEIPTWSIFIVSSIYPFLKISWMAYVFIRAKQQEMYLERKYEPIQLKQLKRDFIREFIILVANLLFLGSCFVTYLLSVGSIFLLLAFLLTFLGTFIDLLRKRSFDSCRLNMIGSLRVIYHVNVLVCVLLICGVAFKTDRLLFKKANWEQLLSPFYFFMTECLLVAIVSFVVLVNSVIQICCHGGMSGRTSRLLSQFEYKYGQESNNKILTNPNALVRVSLWCLYLSICGLLSLFLLLKNAGRLGTTQTSVLQNKGELFILYFGGIVVLTLLFFSALKAWITQFMIQADVLRMDEMYQDNLKFESTQKIIEGIKESIERARIEEEQARAQHNQPDNQTSSDQEDEDGGPNQEYQEQVKTLELILQDPELQSNRVPRYFLKISNAYFMSAFKYYNQEFLKCKQTLKKTLQVEKPTKDEGAPAPKDEGKNKKLGEVLEINPMKYLKTPQRRMNTAHDEEFNHECEASMALFQHHHKDVAFPISAYSERLQCNLTNQQISSPIKNKLVDINHKKQQEPFQKQSRNHKQQEEEEFQKNLINQQDCMICLSHPSDSVITPCGHGGICFECCRQIIAEVVKNEGDGQRVQPAFYMVGDNNQVKIYNFRCPLCRNIGIRVFQLNEPTTLQAPPNKYCQRRVKDPGSIIKAKQYIDLRLNSGSTEPPLLSLQPRPILDREKTQILDETFGFGDDSEEMKESLPIDEQMDDQQLEEMMAHQYAFFEHQDADNFQILRQRNKDEQISNEDGMFDNFDDNMPTCKIGIDQIAIKRPPSPNKNDIANILQPEKPVMIPEFKAAPIYIAPALEFSQHSQEIKMQEIEVAVGSGFKVSEPESRAQVLSISFHLDEEITQNQCDQDAQGEEDDVDYHPNQNSDRESQQHVATIESIGLSVPL